MTAWSAYPYSISKSIVSRRRAADSAVARQGEGNNDTVDLEMELLQYGASFVAHASKG